MLTGMWSAFNQHRDYFSNSYWEDNVKVICTQYLVKSLTERNMYSAELPELDVVCVSSKTWKFILQRTSGHLHTWPAWLQWLIKFSCYIVLICSATILQRVKVKKRSYEANGIYSLRILLTYKHTPLYVALYNKFSHGSEPGIMVLFWSHEHCGSCFCLSVCC